MVTLPVAAHSAPRTRRETKPGSFMASASWPSTFVKTRPLPYWTVHAMGWFKPAPGIGCLAGLVKRVIVPGGREHVKRALGLPLQVGVQLVVGLRERRLHAAGDGVVLIGDGHREVVARGMMAVVRPPVAGAQFLVLGPAVEGGRGEVVDHHALAGAHEVEEGVVGAFAPAQLRLVALVVVQHDQVVGRQGFGTGAAELFGHAHFELAGVFEEFAQHGRGGVPVVTGGSGR